ncbi:MAG TPA: rhodanese-like domain-containing protein [Longimicrobiales bacterium]|nr:rhodanese-like domain-containing protein [Longimicrobiales bacterium]
MHTRMAAAVFSAALLLACDQAADAPPASELAPARAAPQAGETSAALFVDDPAADAQLVFVGQDSTARPAAHADAVFVPLSTFSVERDGIPNEFPPPDSMAGLLEAAGVGAERLLIVGAPIPAGRAYAGLDYLGLGDRAAVYEGAPAALASVPAATRERQRTGLDIDVRDDMIVDAEWVRERLDDPDVAILDARPPDEFSGETPGEGIERPGHIPGARNLFWQTLVQSPDQPRLKEEAELRRIFQEAGVGPEDTIVSYCRTGGQASFLYAVARHLGYDVRLYDGSFIDWSRTDYPVER